MVKFEDSLGTAVWPALKKGYPEYFDINVQFQSLHTVVDIMIMDTQEQHSMQGSELHVTVEIFRVSFFSATYTVSIIYICV